MNWVSQSNLADPFHKYDMLNTDGTPTFEAVKLYEVKAALRIIGDDEDDALLNSLIGAATARLENQYNIRLAEREVTFTFPCLADALKLQLAPVTAITEVTYLDADEERQTLDEATYELVLTNGFPNFCRVPNQSFPSVTQRHGSVIITATAGYAEAALPEALKQAVIISVCDLYKNPDRPLEAQQNVEWLVAPYRKQVGL